MRQFSAARAAQALLLGARAPLAPIVVLAVLAGNVAASPAQAALANSMLAGEPGHQPRVHAHRIHESSLGLPDARDDHPRIRLAQAKGGVLDGLFSIFKPKTRTRQPQHVEAPAALKKTLKTIPYKPQQSATGGSSSIGSDAPSAPNPAAAAKSRSYASYRTICVRLCDGYYWPVNSGTRSSSIARDRNICEDSCQSETKLYIQYSLGADAGDMRDLSGRPYRKLETAFKYRKSYNPECKCRPDPWAKTELMRHQEYRAAEAGEVLGSEASNIPDDDGESAVAMNDDAESDVALVTGDDDSAGDIAPATGVANTPSIATAGGIRRVSLPKPQTSLGLPLVTGVKKGQAKSVAPVLAPADAAARPRTTTVKKSRDINARASR